MEDLQDKIIELMDLFDGEVTTADKIDRPERALEKQAIDDFMDRNPMAGGGLLVKPSADGSRPGYDGRKNRKVSYDTENKIVREYNKYLTDEIIKEVKDQAPSIKKAGGGIARMLGE